VKALSLLLPLDVENCPSEVFSMINGLAAQLEVTVTLLRVVDDTAPESRPQDDLCRDAMKDLLRLERQFLSPHVDSRASIRVGSPWEEICAEAKQTGADWIILAARQLPAASPTHEVATSCPGAPVKVASNLFSMK
jgi:nucleotide-binding universal stress UspA family protein